MSEAETTSLAVIADIAANVPAPVQTGLWQALNNLLGGITAIPAAWLKRPAQAVDDTTTARSAVAAILAKGVAEQALADPVAMQAAAEIYLPSAIRKAKNRVQVAQRAAEHTAEKADDGAQAAPPDDDWMNAFMRAADDASSERLQDLLARILAGQIVRPGSFGLATLRAVSELDQTVATDFSLAWERSAGGVVDYDAIWHRGEYFSRWKRLAEAGLMAQTNVSQYLPPFQAIQNGHALWAPMQADGVWVNVVFRQGCTSSWDHIEFTRVGREIGSLLPRPNYEENLRSAALRLPQQGVARIELRPAGKPTEILFAAPG